MAKVKFGAIITDSRGSIGGQTLKSTQYGPVLITKPQPIRRQTSHTTNAAATFAEQSRAWWDRLSVTQRNDWRALAAANPYTNSWGDEYTLTGIAYFIKLNCRLAAAHLTTTDDAPTDQTVTSVSTLTLTATAPDSLIINFTPSPVPADHILYCFATAAKSPGATNFEGHFFFIGTVETSENSPQDLGAIYLARLPQLYTGRQYAVSIAMLNKTNAALSPPLIATAIAA